MEVTDVHITTGGVKQGRVIGYAVVTINGEFIIHDISIIDGDSDLLVVMPSRTSPSGEFQVIVSVVTPEARQKIRDAVLREYSRTR